jgi:hypothetical protein
MQAKRISATGVLFAALTLASTSLLAGPAGKDTKEIAPAPPQSFTDVTLSASHVGESNFEQGNGRYGSQSATGTQFTAKYHVPLTGNWFLVLGASYGRFDFSLGNAPVPSHLQEAEGIIAIEYRKNDTVGFLFETRPGVYFANDITSSAFDSPTVLAAAWEITDTFALMGGVSYARLRNYPVLPIIGARWIINDRWTLRAILPNPRLIYKASDNLQFWVGGELTGGAYRTDRRDIHPSSLNGATVTYYETRVGAGMIWNPCSGGSVELGAGYALSRTFDYHRADEEYDLEPAPYIGAKVTLKF